MNVYCSLGANQVQVLLENEQKAKDLDLNELDEDLNGFDKLVYFTTKKQLKASDDKKQIKLLLLLRLIFLRLIHQILKLICISKAHQIILHNRRIGNINL